MKKSLIIAALVAASVSLVGCQKDESSGQTEMQSTVSEPTAPAKEVTKETTKETAKETSKEAPAEAPKP